MKLRLSSNHKQYSWHSGPNRIHHLRSLLVRRAKKRFYTFNRLKIHKTPPRPTSIHHVADSLKPSALLFSWLNHDVRRRISFSYLLEKMRRRSPCTRHRACCHDGKSASLLPSIVAWHAWNVAVGFSMASPASDVTFSHCWMAEEPKSQ